MSVYGNFILESFSIDLESLLEESFDDINYTAEEVCTMSEYFNSIDPGMIINEGVASDNLVKMFTKLGIAQEKASEAKKLVNQAGKEIADDVKKNGINKSSPKRISGIVEGKISQLVEILKSVETDTLKYEKYDANKIMKAVICTGVASFLNSIFIVAFMAILGPNLGMKVGAVIMAPITEELAKKVSIKGGFTAEFAVVFNLLEATSYVKKLTAINVPLINAVKLRLMAVGMHLTTTIIEFLTSNEKVQKFLKLDKQEDKDRLSFIGHLIGMLIHATWNYMASFSSGFKDVMSKASGIDRDILG